MPDHVHTIIVGQGLAGSVMAWTLVAAGHKILILDRDPPSSASRIAAGLITPLSGQKLVRPPDFDTQWQTAHDFYRNVEAETGDAFFDVTPMIRLFAHAEERDDFLNRANTEITDTCRKCDVSLQRDGAARSGIAAAPAGRLNVRRFLDATRTHFCRQDRWVRADIDVAKDLIIEPEGVVVRSQNLRADRVVLCTGAAANTCFPSIPDNPSRGDILNVSIENYLADAPTHRGIWIAPNNSTQDVGATYDWKTLNEQPSAAGREELLSRLADLVDGTVVVNEHRAAVRPTMKDYQPVVGQHAQHKRLFVLNGLGSKGTLRAPTMARLLCELIDHGHDVPAAVNVRRLDKYKRPSDGARRPLTQRAQQLVDDIVSPGDSVIDATVGNGFDTCFLAQATGPAGTVVGFDIQQTAIQSTQQRLSAAGFTNVELRHESHEHLSAVPENSVSAVMFNLGYLPRGDHAVTTRSRSSVQAIEAAVRALKPGGIVTVLSYRGHDGGPEEFAAVERLLSNMANRYDLERFESSPPRPTAPVLFALTKVKSHES